MGKGNLIVASRCLLLQKIKITSSCRTRFNESLTSTTFPTLHGKILARGFHEVSGGSSSSSSSSPPPPPPPPNSRKASVSQSLTEELEDILKPEDIARESSTSSTICIYKVPNTMRQVNRKAYEPNIVSIGPYHHGVESLKEMENLKRVYFRRLFQLNYNDQLHDDVVLVKKAVLDDARKAMEKLEAAARSCYSEESKLSSKKFVKMMLLDGCFIIGLLRDSVLQPDFEHTPSIIQRWMLPTLRQDLIKLENQLPLFVLRKLFQLTKASTTCHEQSISSTNCWELEAQAFRFFKPLLRGHAGMNKPLQHFAPKQCQGSSSKHFLDLFHNRISPDCSTCPVLQEPRRGEQAKQILSVQELKKAGVKFSTDANSGPLDITFSRRAWGWGKVLTIPPIHIDDHRGTLFRNMVAFEKCQRNCHQDVTSYLFFLDSLINSAKDVGLLHYYGVLHHSLGSNRRVAKLVNNLCKEVAPDVSQSYLYKVVGGVNEYYSSNYGKIRGFLVHHHFSSWLVGISTIGACLALYLTLIQTGCGVATARKDLENQISLASLLKEPLFLKNIFEYIRQSLSRFKGMYHKLHSGSTENKALDPNDMEYWPYNMI